MRTEEEVATVQALARRGLNNCQIARSTGIPRSTVRDWIAGRLPQYDKRDPAEKQAQIHPGSLPRLDYAYLLGKYLGDGYIAMTPKGGYRLRIALDSRYPGIIIECAAAMRATMPSHAVHVQDRHGWNMVGVGCYSKAWPSLFPQHGPGQKHLRKIELAEWQREIVERHPKPFLRGLIHSDGCRVINKSMGHEYVRYFFTNASEDIRELFGHTCDQLGIGWRQQKEREISIARRADVGFLDEFIGPKY